MAQTAVFNADFSKWNASIRDAVSTLKPLELEAKGLQQQLQKLAVSYSGQATIKAATATAEAIKAIGGATTLTASEQKKANAVLDEAIEKYARLGQTAPESIQKVSNELKSLQAAQKQNAAAADESGVSFGKLAASYITAQAAIDVVKSGLSAVSGFLLSSLDSYAEAEAGQKRLTVAMQNQGTATPAAIDQMNKLADAMQRETAFSDDATTAAEALLIQVGNVLPTQMDKALKASADLAAGLGIGLEEAAGLVAKAVEGNVGALGRYGIKLDETAIKVGGLDAVVSVLEDRFGGQATAQLETYAGMTQKLANDWDNLKEAVGGAIANDEEVKQFFKDAPELIAEVTSEVGLLVDAFKMVRDEYKQFQNIVSFGTTGAVEKFRQQLADAKKNGIGFFGQKLPTEKPPDVAPPEKSIAQLGAAAKAVDQVTRGLKALGDASDKAKDRTRQFEEQVETLRKQITGQAAEGELRKLALAWRSLSVDQQHDGQVVKQVLDLYNKLRPNLRDLPADLEHLRETYTPVIESHRAINTLWESSIALAPQVADGANRVANALNGLNLSGTLVSHGLKDQRGLLIDLGVQMKAIPANVKSVEVASKLASKATVDWSQNLDDLASSFGTLAQVSGGSFAAIVKDIATLVAAMSTARKASFQFKDGIGQIGASFTKETHGAITQTVVDWEQLGNAITQTAAAAIAGASAIAQATAEGSKGHRVAGGALAGAEAGAAFGPIGMGVGAGIGALVGFYRAEQAAEKAAASARVQIAQLGGAITKSFGSMKLATAIAKEFNVNLEAALARGGPEGAAMLQAAFDEMTAKQEHLNELLDEYGLSWRDLGADFQASHILDNVNQLNQDWADLAGAGVPLDQIIGSMSGKINEFLADALASGQKLPPQFEAIVEQLIRMGKITDANARALMGMGDEATVDFKKMEEVAKKYGISLDALGPKFQAAKIHDAAQQIIDDFLLLTNSGADVNGVLDGMSDEISQLVQDAIKSGTALPDTMKPWIEQLLKAGKLVDANGDKLTDISQLQFEKPLAKAVDDLIGKLDELIDKLGDVYGGIEKIPDHINVHTSYTSDGTPPDQQHGGGGASSSTSGSGAPPGHGPNGPPNAPGHALGGIIRAQMGKLLPFAPERGTDRVPYYGTEGERVLSVPQTQRIDRWLAGLESGRPMGPAPPQQAEQTNNVQSFSFNIEIHAIDQKGLREVVERDVAPMLVELYRKNSRGTRTSTRQALGVAS